MTQATNKGLPNRWLLAGGGVLMQLALGAVYAWSVFRNPLMKTFGWSISDVTTTFSIAILVLGFAAFLGGLWMRRVGPRVVGIIAGICYGLGVALASLANGNIWILWLTYGVLGGLGLGLGYIVPLATLVKWFPDRRGFITGLAVAGFGAGALITAPVAENLIAGVGVLKTLAILGIDYLIMVVLGASVMRNPPEGWMPAGWQPTAKQQDQLQARNYTLKEALSTWQWYVLWAMLFLNVTAGISIISQASPMAQEISGVSAAVGAGMVGVISIGNGIGRLFWAWSSDAIGRRNVFLIMFLLQAALFFLLPSLRQFTMLALVCFIIISCYGGGFGTMPAFAADYFGPKWVGSIYGLMLTAWGLAGVFGPLLIANIRQATGNYGGALIAIACILLVSSLLPVMLRPHRAAEEVAHAKPVGRI
ncbi:MAG TPA: OFA family MFS transporter [Chthoniobacterales bacterium]|nr:OFA family MFS transporter [Chthoniobacterales bacterium]